MTTSKHISLSIYSDIENAISGIGTNNATLIIDSCTSISGDLVIPSNIQLNFIEGCKITIPIGLTLKIRSWISVGIFQIFEGAGRVIFEGGNIMEIYPQWWGAKADFLRQTGAVPNVQSPTDNINAFRKAITCWFGEGTNNANHNSLYWRGGTIKVPSGNYWFSQTLRIDKAVKIIGNSVSQRENSSFYFPKNIDGLYIEGLTTSVFSSFGSDTLIEGISIIGVPSVNFGQGAISYENDSLPIYSCSESLQSGHGIYMKFRATLKECSIYGMGADGIHIDTEFPSAVDNNNTEPSNSNHFYLEKIMVSECDGNGIYVIGSDSNIGVGIHIHAKGNKGIGIYDDSAYGCCWIGCYTEVNIKGSYKSGYDENKDCGSRVSYPSFIYCNDEGDGGAAPSFNVGTSVIGGTLASKSGNWSRIGLSNDKLNISAFYRDEATGKGHRIIGGLPEVTKDELTLLSFVHNKQAKVDGSWKNGPVSQNWKLHKWLSKPHPLEDKWVLSNNLSPYYSPFWWSDGGNSDLKLGQLGLGQLANSRCYWRVKKEVVISGNSDEIFELPAPNSFFEHPLFYKGRIADEVDIQATFVYKGQNLANCDVSIIGVQISRPNAQTPNTLRVRLRNNINRNTKGNICIRITIDENVNP